MSCCAATSSGSHTALNGGVYARSSDSKSSTFSRACSAAAITLIRPGAIMKEVDAAARKIIEHAGYAKQFNHSLGHGIGLAVHELPRLAPDQERQLAPGMVVTVEPGIYLPGWGGVRIEDDVLVTNTGSEVMTSLPKELEQCIVNAL